MDYFVTSGAPSRQRTGCAIVAIFERRRLSSAAQELDTALGGRITELVRRGDHRGELGQTLLLSETSGARCERILLLGCGPTAKFGRKQYVKALSAAIDAIAKTGTRDAINYLLRESVKDTDVYYLARLGAETGPRVLYRPNALKSGKKPPLPSLRRLGFGVIDRRARADAERGARDGGGIAEGVKFARDLANLPPNVCTPSYLARSARSLARNSKRLTATVLGETELRRHGMGAFLSVTNGSEEPAKMIVLRYRGAPATQHPIVLVGKGITFDAGGISLKPPLGMDEMKFDMSGAAAVLGTIVATDDLSLPINVVAILPCCENLPGGAATKPGDVVKSMSGKTIEVLNTDAEGRLILCDALTYGRRFKPNLMIDVATLTGACVIALGAHYTGLMSNDDDLARELTEASVRANDQAWHMPLDDDYGESLKSNFADFANVGGREGGAITAACFLSRFTQGVRWAHLDIAGTAYLSGAKKGSTGRPVPMLIDFLMTLV